MWIHFMRVFSKDNNVNIMWKVNKILDKGKKRLYIISNQYKRVLINKIEILQGLRKESEKYDKTIIR